MFDIAINALCDYSDLLAEQGEHSKRKMVQECIAVIHNAYKAYDDQKRAIGKYTAQDRMEGIILGMKGLTVYKAGNKVWYEYPSVADMHNIRRSDRPDEVLDYIVKSWNVRFGDIQSEYMKTVTRNITDRMMKEEKFGGDEKRMLRAATLELRALMEEGIKPQLKRGKNDGKDT